MSVKAIETALEALGLDVHAFDRAMAYSAGIGDRHFYLQAKRGLRLRHA